jgi:alkylation response protein AidB-like acyl-CoA dehydrogenase
MGRSSEFFSGLASDDPETPSIDYLDLMQRTGQAADGRLAGMSGRALTYRAVAEQLAEHVYRGVNNGSMTAAAGSITRLFYAEARQLEIDTATAIASSAAAVGDEPALLDIGRRYLERQVISLGGGSTEMARNVISERVLNLPREYAADRGVPFNQVRRGNSC